MLWFNEPKITVCEQVRLLRWSEKPKNMVQPHGKPLFNLGPFKDENLDMMKKYLDNEVIKFSFQTMCIEYIEYLEDGMLPSMTNILWIEVE